MTSVSHQSLATKICPWLLEPLEQLERARSEGRFAHGWLLAGPEGIGKINLALVAAHRLLHPQAARPQPLGPAEGARAMAVRHEPSDHHPDLHWIFPEADRRTVSVDQIRETTGSLTLTSMEGPKVVILEPADAMTTAAANALLKTLEEPTARTYLLLLTHQPGRLPATIRSRCQYLPVPRPGMGEALGWLRRSETEATESEWSQLLALAEGAPFRAMAFQDNNYTCKNKEFERQFELISNSRLDPQTVADQWLKDDLELALSWLAAHLRWVIRARMAPEASNPITDLKLDRLHNAWQVPTLRTLFQRLERTEALLRQLGGGINADLATRALLLGFQDQRGRL